MKFHEGETTCDVCSRVLCNVGALRKHKNRGACHKWNNKLLNDSNNVLSQRNNHQNEVGSYSSKHSFSIIKILMLCSITKYFLFNNV